MKGPPSYVPGTNFEKVSKLMARYVEFSKFKSADTSKGYFCGCCVYYFEDKRECAIVQSEGESADGDASDQIAPYGMCALWKNPTMIRK
jgi:hypothetical protein